MEHIHSSWKSLFEEYDIDLDSIYSSGSTVYPPKENVFKVFEMNVTDIKVVFLGQDPYHNPGQANGLSFSVNDGITAPPSLKNIYKELNIEFPEREYTFKSGNLDRWFKEEKIFLLNASLTVEKNDPGSHMDLWESFTDDVIKYISERNKNCVFLLLGNFAKSKKEFLEKDSKIIEGVHPSPMAASRGFFNSNIFKNVEAKLGKKINWSL
jgi:uracil-DNA glycosylase